jgi:hypothetical protein
VLAERLRAAKDEMPQFMSLQDLRREKPAWIVKHRIKLEDVVQGVYAAEYLAVSHRWEDRDTPDLYNVQLQCLQRYLAAHPHIKYVFYDVRGSQSNSTA